MQVPYPPFNVEMIRLFTNVRTTVKYAFYSEIVTYTGRIPKICFFTKAMPIIIIDLVTVELLH